MNSFLKAQPRPPSGLSPRPEDTPRTRQLKELRHKRLIFYEKSNQAINNDNMNKENKGHAENDICGKPKNGLIAESNVLKSQSTGVKSNGTVAETTPVRQLYRYPLVAPTNQVTSNNPEHSAPSNQVTSNNSDQQQVDSIEICSTQQKTNNHTCEEDDKISEHSSTTFTVQNINIPKLNLTGTDDDNLGYDNNCRNTNDNGKMMSPRPASLIRLESLDEVINDEDDLDSARFHLPYSGIVDAPMLSSRSEKGQCVPSLLTQGVGDSADFIQSAQVDRNIIENNSFLTSEKEVFSLDVSKQCSLIDAQYDGQVCSYDEDVTVNASFDPNSLQNLLGEERYMRLMSNFKESEDYEDDGVGFINSKSNNVGHTANDSVLISSDSLHLYEHSSVNGWWKFDSDDEDYVSNLSMLQTHRPPESTVLLQEAHDNNNIQISSHLDNVDVVIHDNQPENTPSQRNYIQNLASSNVKCAFSADEIYQQADQLSHRDSLSSFSESDFLDDKSSDTLCKENVKQRFDNQEMHDDQFAPEKSINGVNRLYPNLEPLISDGNESDVCTEWLRNITNVNNTPHQELGNVKDTHLNESQEVNIENGHAQTSYPAEEPSPVSQPRPIQLSEMSPRPSSRYHNNAYLNKDSRETNGKSHEFQSNKEIAARGSIPKSEMTSSTIFQHRNGKDLKNVNNYSNKISKDIAKERNKPFSFSLNIEDSDDISKRLKEQLAIKMNQLDSSCADPNLSTFSSLDSVKLSDSLLDKDARRGPSPLLKHLRDQLTLRLSDSVETLNGKTQGSLGVKNGYLCASFESLDLRDSYEIDNPPAKPLSSLPRALREELNLELETGSGVGGGSRSASPDIDIEVFEREDQLETSRSRAEIREFLDVPALPMLGSENGESARSNEIAMKCVQKNHDEVIEANSGAPALLGILKLPADASRNQSDAVDKSVVINDNVARDDDLSDEDVMIDDEPCPDEEESSENIYHEFIEKLVADPRFQRKKPDRPWSAGLPAKSKSQSRPRSAGNVRPQSANSKVKAYVKTPPYKRHWERSSIAWSSYNAGELNTRSSLKGKNQSLIKRAVDLADTSNKKEYSAVNTYTKYIEMSPRILTGDFSLWLCLPDEVLLLIFSFLPHRDLARCAQVCSQFSRVASDSTLWRTIQLRNSSSVCDSWLSEMGKHRPTSLSLIKAEGEQVTSEGLRELFRQCADSLQELSINGCNKGQLCGDIMMLHVAARCHCISRLDISWSNITDNGVAAIAESSKRLTSVSLNGCQAITDEAVNVLTSKHGQSLLSLELFGCFGLTSSAASYIQNKCTALITLNMGQCWKLSDSSLAQLTINMKQIEHLDLRGCKQMRDSSVHQIMRNCPHLKSISLANCSNLTDVSLLEIATYSPNIESLDVCGCKNITDGGVRSLSSNCKNISYLDLSSTAITYKSVSTVANYCNQQLDTIKLNFCKSITEKSLIRLAKHCKKLKKIYLYGNTTIRNLENIKAQNKNVWIEI